MDIYFELKTTKSHQEAVEAVKASLLLYGFGVLFEMNFKDKLKEKGLEFDTDFTVLEVCNPSKAKKVLDHDIIAGYFLPCKLAVFNKDNATFIGMLKPTTLIELSGVVGLVDVADEVEADLIASITEAV